MRRNGASSYTKVSHLRFAVLADSHIGRSIPLAVAEHRRKAFSVAFSRAVDAMIGEGVDYVFFCGDLFERRTLRPHLVQFAHDELYRLAVESYKRHGKKIKIFIIRGNHDGRPQSDTLDYIKHPLAEYLIVFDDERMVYSDGVLHVVGLNYYDEIEEAFERFAKPALRDPKGLPVLMIHGFVSAYHEIPPGASYLTLDQLSDAKPRFVLAGHYHKGCQPKRLRGGGHLLTPGSLEMYDFAEGTDKGFYIVDYDGMEPAFRWIGIEPMHLMKQVDVKTERRQSPAWYRSQIAQVIKDFTEELRLAGKPGYIRVAVKGELSEGFPSDITMEQVENLRKEQPLLLWVDVDTMGLDLPPMVVRADHDQVNIAEFFSAFGEFAGDIQEMHGRVKETLEEEASAQTGLLTPSQRILLLEEWLRRFEENSFRRGEN